MKVSVIKYGDKYKVQFNQDNQYFTLDYLGSKKMCKWMANMLKKAFYNYKNEK